ncbi:MAG: serine/threonine-protein kinase [Microbacterium sp.]
MDDVDEGATLPLLDGRYQLLECVGQGAMAKVYRADDVMLGRTVAVKLMRAEADVLTSPARARNEMTVLASLSHPSLVKLFDGSMVPGRAGYLVMEFVDGATLGEELRKGPLRPGDAQHLAGELASALHVVHEAGIVHRDVKPSNILLTPTGIPARPHHAKLADFGIAYLLDSTHVTTPGTVIGTAAYLAPEQVRGEQVTGAADVYALGLVLLEALTGQRAFPHASGIGAVMARLADPPAIPDWVGPGWSRLLGDMTATDAADRPSAIEVATRVIELADASPSPPPVPPLPAAAAALGAPSAGASDAPTLLLGPAGASEAAGTAQTRLLNPVPPAAQASPAPPRTRAPGWVRAVVLLGSAAAALLLAVQVGLWAGGGSVETPEPVATVPSVPEPSEEAPVVDEQPTDTVLTEDEKKQAEEEAKKAEEERKKAEEEERKRAEKEEKKGKDEEDD